MKARVDGAPGILMIVMMVMMVMIMVVVVDRLLCCMMIAWDVVVDKGDDGLC